MSGIDRSGYNRVLKTVRSFYKKNALSAPLKHSGEAIMQRRLADRLGVEAIRPIARDFEDDWILRCRTDAI